MSYLASEAVCPYFIYDDISKRDGCSISCEFGKIIFGDKIFHSLLGYGVCAMDFESCMFKKILDKEYHKMNEAAKKAVLKRLKEKRQNTGYYSHLRADRTPEQKKRKTTKRKEKKSK